MSEPAKVKEGGKKKKSKADTHSSVASREAPRPYRVATMITPSRYTMIRLETAKYGTIAQAIAATFCQASPGARARRMAPDAVRALVDRHIERRFLGVFGEPHVNVRALNLAPDDR